MCGRIIPLAFPMTRLTSSAVSVLVYRVLAVSVVAIPLSACGGGNGSDANSQTSAQGTAMAVEAIRLTPRPVEQKTEYVATVKSRRSTTIQPQVEGFITRIVSRAGQRVGRGTLLMEIDSNRQQAAVASLESVRAAREADLQWARQQADRTKKLYDAGAISQQEFEQAAIGVRTAQAQWQAVEAQIREQRVELAFHRVTAPTAGIVGDIPVRVGDRVTQSTVLTTIDENAGLELYINIPVAQAPGLKPGMPVRVVGDGGEPLVDTKVNFISPSVDTETQSVLVKAPLDGAVPFRTDQFVRTHVIWSTTPGLTVPLVAVTRINGQYFAYVVERGAGGQAVARQRAVTLGEIVGNDYIVRGGLEEGEELIVAGIQKIADGMAVTTTAASGANAGGPSAPKQEGR